jgi:hypothetical protein
MNTRQAALALVVAACAASPACASEALRATSIAGTLGTWGVALAEGWPLLQCAEDGVRLSLGGAKDRELTSATLGLSRSTCTLHAAQTWSLAYRPVLLASAWKADDGAGARSAWDVAAVPMLHWSIPGGAAVYGIELGIGPAWLSETDVGSRVKSTHFQFSDHLGVSLGDPGARWNAAVVYRHVSNLNIREPNNSVDFKGVMIELKL